MNTYPVIDKYLSAGGFHWAMDLVAYGHIVGRMSVPRERWYSSYTGEIRIYSGGRSVQAEAHASQVVATDWHDYGQAVVCGDALLGILGHGIDDD